MLSSFGWILHSQTLPSLVGSAKTSLTVSLVLVGAGILVESFVRQDSYFAESDAGILV